MDSRDWDYIRELGLRPGIRTPEDYAAAVARGAFRAQEFLLNQPIDNPSHAVIKLCHYLLLDEVHDWAGNYRSPGQEVAIGLGPASKPEYIHSEIEMIGDTCAKWLTSQDLEMRIQGIAAYHVAFEAIHPFCDGNGRTGRLLAEAQAERFLGVHLHIASDKERYLQALFVAQTKQKLEPITDLIIDSSGLRQQIDAQRIEQVMDQAREQLRREHLEHSRST